jgi:asparagine synthetase B (glutamine-hydrolysing)
VALLGSFSLNSDVVPWLLASGTLGPGLSWDRRITHLEPATSVTLDRSSWALTTKTEPARFSVLEAIDEDHARRLRTSLKDVIDAASLDLGQWALTLSGGIDCRAILCLLNDTAGLKAVTWGLRASQWERSNDAYVVRTLARQHRLDHSYYETDLSQEAVEPLFERYIRCGEGRIDHISGYADGFQLWKRLYESGIRGVIRGDQVFGRQSVSSPKEVRLSAGMPLWPDFRGVGRLEDYGIPPQTIPDSLLQQPHESLETWRDRLQQHYRVPFVLAALSDLKLPYVEIVSPLLSGSLVEEIRKLPDHLRTNKALLRSIAQSLSRTSAFASTLRRRRQPRF